MYPGSIQKARWSYRVLEFLDYLTLRIYVLDVALAMPFRPCGREELKAFTSSLGLRDPKIPAF
jgi:hypothetical protein